MAYFRIVIPIFFLLLSAYFGYFLFTFDASYELQTAEDLFLDGEFEEADTVLEKLTHAIPFTQFHLYRAYTARAHGQIDESNSHLKEAMKHPVNNSQSNILLELFLNRMLNAYLQKDSRELLLSINKAKQLIKAKNGWLPLFSGIESYLTGNYSQAVMNFKRSTPRDNLSPWMKKVFHKVFTPHWFTKHLAYCQMELGNMLVARQELKKGLEIASEKERDEVNFFLGMSYIKELEAKSHHVSVPYYKLAFSYFIRIPRWQEKFPKDREHILSKVRENVNEAMEDNSFQDLTFYSKIFKSLNAKEEMVRLKQQLISVLERERLANHWEKLEQLTAVLGRVIEKGELRESLRSQFETLAESALEEEKFEHLKKYWDIARLFNDDTERLTDTFAEQTADKVFLIIADDDATLTRTAPYLSFWKMIEKDHENRYHFANTLVSVAEDLWKKKKEKDKAIHVINIARALPFHTHKGLLNERIEKSFQEMYALALRQDDIGELMMILNAVNTLELANVDIFVHQEKVNQLEDAAYLLANKRHDVAKKKAQWIHKLDPQNQEANQILGMIAYDEANYNEAFDYLQNVETSDLDVIEAQAVIQILLGDIQKGHQLLEKVAKSRSIGLETYLRLGFGLLIQDKNIAALQWFDKVEEDVEEAFAGRCFLSFSIQSWNEALDAYKKLPAPYFALDGFHGIAIESLTALGEISEAEEILRNLLKRPPQPENSMFSKYFQAFKKEKLDHWNRYFVAALFFKVVKEDNKKALEHFERIEDPLPLAQIEKAEVLLDLGLTYEAKQQLFLVLEEIHGSEREKEVKRRLLPMLGATLTRLGFFVEAWSYYRDYLFLFPEDNTYRSEYAKTLIQLQRYDLALDQYRLLIRSAQLSPSEKLSFIKCLVYTNQFIHANKYALKWLTRTSVPFVHQVELARLMIITQNDDLLDKILNNTPEPERRTIAENQQLIRLWIDFGYYEEAEELVHSLELELEKTSEGLMVLADLYVQLSRLGKALAYAQRASQLAPEDFNIADFIERYERKPGIIAESVKLHKEKIEEDPTGITLQIDYATDLIDLAIETFLSGEIANLDESSNLHQARAILEKIITKNKGIPEVYFLLGKVFYLLDHNTEAKEAYLSALRFNLSYIEASQHLALVYEELDEMNKAIEVVQNAVRFNPNDAEVWEQLARLQMRMGNPDIAIDALKKAIRYTPNEPDPYVSLAKIYLEIKNPETAIENLEKVLRFSPDNIEALTLMLKILHDPNLETSVEDQESLKRRRLEFYDRLYVLDPEEAEAIRSKHN